MKIEGQAALVTGGGSGLGEAVARELARLGAKVAVLDVNAAGAERVASAIGAGRAIGTIRLGLGGEERGRGQQKRGGQSENPTRGLEQADN